MPTLLYALSRRRCWCARRHPAGDTDRDVVVSEAVRCCPSPQASKQWASAPVSNVCAEQNGKQRRATLELVV